LEHVHYTLCLDFVTKYLKNMFPKKQCKTNIWENIYAFIKWILQLHGK
jgi:hypothetical protein